VLGPGNNLYQLLDVEDLCEAISLCASLGREKVNDTFNVGAKTFGNMRDNFQAVLDRAGHGKHVVSIPLRPALLLLELMDLLHLSPLYPWIYATAAQESYVSIHKLESRLGFTPRHSNRDALIRNYDWYVAHRTEFKGQTGVTHRLPWKKGLLALAKQVF
jgi:nucleoside-diphosphate-sugar epimerase